MHVINLLVSPERLEARLGVVPLADDVGRAVGALGEQHFGHNAVLVDDETTFHAICVATTRLKLYFIGTAITTRDCRRHRVQCRQTKWCSVVVVVSDGLSDAVNNVAMPIDVWFHCQHNFLIAMHCAVHVIDS